MRALLSSIYGLAAYLAFTAALGWFVGFSGNLLVPKSVDFGGAPGGTLEALSVDALLLLLFGVQHSVMARRSFKRWWTRIVPAELERSTFVVASSVVLLVVMWLWIPVGTPVVWRVENAAVVAAIWGVFALGWVIAMLSTFLLDHFELFGLRQSFSGLLKRPAPDAVFRTPLLYRHVRHPLYLGFLLTFWAVPVMTLGHLLLALGLSAYILVGIAFEERDLLREFGERYRSYRRQVGMLLPRIGGAGRARERRAPHGGVR
ncbi:MAG TPA: isoprenylcysteine carboxylmethyltransferase family protein [Burkholderiaceae bacterium]